MKQKNRITFFVLIVTMTIFPQCNAQQTNKDSNMRQEFINSNIISETEEYIERLENLYRDNRKNYGNLPFIGNDDFFICFDINRQNKQQNAGSHNHYWLHIIPDNNDYKTKIKLGSSTFYFEGYDGHKEIRSEWTDGGELGTLVLNYYFAHQSTIPVYIDPDNIAVSDWKPLFAISESQYVLKMTKFKFIGGFVIHCEVLDVRGPLINGELMRYNISTHTLQFQPKGESYWVWIRNLTSKTYINGGKDSKEVIIPYNTSEGWAGEINFSRKVLEYYLAHKSEIETTKDIRE